MKSYCEVCARFVSCVDIFLDNQKREIIACVKCFNRLASGERAEDIYEEKRREKSNQLRTN